MTVKILTDSASDLPLHFYEENNITLFPLKVLIDEHEYKDLKDISPKQLYDRIREGHMPKTSQVSPEEFETVFTKMAENNETGIYIAFSSQLSGTYQTAVMIAEQVKENFPKFDLTIVDTKCASLGQGLIVKEASRLAQEGATKEVLLRDIRFQCTHMEHLFTVEDLDYLAKGGRVSKTSAFIGGLLHIKPLLNVEDGKLVPIEKVRSRKKVLRRILELMEQRGTELEKQTIGITHADDEITALEMKKQIEEKFQPKEVIISSIGATIGAHTGPGAISFFFLNRLPSS
ncbi:DegV family protein [Bacillaceae bacterium Marseille-Q3522]|nr:DegV family protein [Bacillaceae bacterium Marseille-Q3522]